MLLFLAERHEALTLTSWSEDRARNAIARIVADTEAAFSPAGLWKLHPTDVSPERPHDCLKPLYNGAAGVIWSLHDLQRKGHVTLKNDYAATANTLAARHAADIAQNQQQRDYLEKEIGPFAGTDWGIALLQQTLTPSTEQTDALHDLLQARIGNNQGIVWGGAGSMLAALFLHESTGEQRWRDLYIRHFDALWQTLTHDPKLGCHLWTVDLYGRVAKRMTALHGFFANAGVMLRGRAFLSPQRQEELRDRIAQTLRATARIEGPHANWPVNADDPDDPTAYYVQVCNGAPGAIVTLADLPPDATTDDLLLKAGEVIWHAGAPVKLPGLCHGAPGSGFALLKLYARTNDPVWLDRARRFAMHGIEQADTARAKYGQRKYALWTGNLGLALFLAACLTGDARFPTLDYF